VASQEELGSMELVSYDIDNRNNFSLEFQEHL
jgi:hypothetical protein